MSRRGECNPRENCRLQALGSMCELPYMVDQGRRFCAEAKRHPRVNRCRTKVQALR